MAICPAVTAGWYCGRQMTPVPATICFVLGSTWARKSSGEVICSDLEL